MDYDLRLDFLMGRAEMYPCGSQNIRQLNVARNLSFLWLYNVYPGSKSRIKPTFAIRTMKPKVTKTNYEKNFECAVEY